MTHFSHYPLQQAVYELLSGDSTLLTLVEAVYDRPPEGSAYPYVTLGESKIVDWSTKTTVGTEQHLKLHIWSRNGGRKEIAIIMERIYVLLHQASMSVTGHTLVLMRFVSSEIILENDGYTYQGAMVFRALLESA